MSAARMDFAPLLSAETLRILSQNATPGPWDAFRGHVSAIAVAPDPTLGVTDYSKSSEDSHAFYGGELICESCDRDDAMLIAAMRNTVPALVEAHLALIKRVSTLESDLRLARAELADEKAMVNLVRSTRYSQPRFAIVLAEAV